MIKKITIYILFFLTINLFASYEEGKKVFENKCSSCHGAFIEINTLKENFFVKDNKLLNLKAPTVNMLAYAIMDSPKKIGDPADIEMRQLEIEQYLKSYLENPNRFFSICDEHILKYYDNKPSLKGQLSDEEYTNLSYFFMDYKKNKEAKKTVVKNDDIDENAILQKAKKEKKLIMIYATTPDCFFCRKMEKDVLSHDDIKKQIDKNYIFVKVDVSKSSLPFNLVEKYKKITPSFFVLNQKGDFLTQYPGSWTKADFIEILKENIK